MTAPDETPAHSAFRQWAEEEMSTSHGREFCQVFDILVDPSLFEDDTAWRRERERWAKINKAASR